MGCSPFFILAIRSLLNKPLVFSCSGQLMVTTSHWPNISSKLSTRRQPISFSFSGASGLVVEVQQLLALEGLEAAQHALADAAHRDGADDFSLEVVLVLGHGRHVPVAARPTCSCAGTKLRTSARMVMTTCSATDTTLDPVTSATVMPPLVLLAASRSTWSEPMPAVTASLSFFALARRSAVR